MRNTKMAALAIVMLMLIAPIAYAAESLSTTDAKATGGGSAKSDASSEAINQGNAVAESHALGTNGGDAQSSSVSVAVNGGTADAVTYATATDDGKSKAGAASVALGPGAVATTEADANSAGKDAGANAGAAAVAVGKNARADGSAEADAQCNDRCDANAGSSAIAVGDNANAEAHSDAKATSKGSNAGAGSAAFALGDDSSAVANSQSDAKNGGKAASLSEAHGFGEDSFADSATTANANGKNTLASSTARTWASEDSTAQANLVTNAMATSNGGAISVGIMTAVADPSGARTSLDALLLAGTVSARDLAVATIEGSSYTNAGGEPAAGIIIDETGAIATGHDSIAGINIDAIASTGHHTADKTSVKINTFANGVAFATSTIDAWAKHLYQVLHK